MNFVMCHYNGFPILINMDRVTIIKSLAIDGRTYTKLDDQLVDDPISHFSFTTWRIVEDEKPTHGEAIPKLAEEGKKEKPDPRDEDPDPNFHGNSV